ncbi:MAG: DUF2851 family protein [Candidatus Marinimicrobia bacterium]|nr:DUF2851 family protein [Candidatus Neomarinimicrobiota bacterium]MDD4960621.1 DUF2851 family protein [Candidatus Neomarinimicrobiota bacterium]MDD5709597.1 DUF2851 family protein [Candidatus Neomarinimicrobiota bacterium]MDX9777457.1 DUF2851 family protein [bacterium]
MKIRSFQHYLELFEPRELYVSELRLQKAWIAALWKKARVCTDGRVLKVICPGRHNLTEGPDFRGARVFVGERLFEGDIEVHRHAGDWYAHGHQHDTRYQNCILHLVFHPPAPGMLVRDKAGRAIPTCYIELEEVLSLEPRESCREFCADPEACFAVLQEHGWRRAEQKIRYFYRQHERFPYDVMMFWGLFKACGYAHNEENMIRLFMLFPWEDYIGGRLKKDLIHERLMDLAGFGAELPVRAPIRWTYSGTRPPHYPERRIAWLSALLQKFYGIPAAETLYELLDQDLRWERMFRRFFSAETEEIPKASEPGSAIRKEIVLNTLLPLMEAIRLEKKDSPAKASVIRNYMKNAGLPQIYGVADNFYRRIGIPEKDKRRRNWMCAQGILYIRDHYCSQELMHCCPICTLAQGKTQ